jgi:hypothetical protein
MAAVIVAVPRPTVDATPAQHGALFMLATPAVAVQVAEAVTSWVDVSLNVPVAVKATVLPRGTVELLGVTAMDMSVAVVTVMLVVPFTPPKTAVTVVVPGMVPLTTPFDPVVFPTSATVGSPVLQLTSVVMFLAPLTA